MHGSKQNISRENIELEIYKVFEQIGRNKRISIAGYLKNFKIKPFKTREYRSIDYTYESLVKLILFQHLKGIKFCTKLTKYLKRHPADKFKLGFSKTPDRRTISYFFHHILDDETRELLNFTASKIEKISEKFGILLDVKILTPEKTTKATKIQSQYLQKREKTQKICKLFKKRLSPFLNMNMGHNTKYTKNQFIDLMIHMGQTKDFAENGNKTFREIRACNCPDADTLLYHLKKYDNSKEIQRMFLTLFEIVWEMARQSNTINKRKKYDIALDFTELYFYGDRSTPMVVGKKPEKGTTKCYKFITINIVEHGKRFTLLALPMGPFDDKNKLLKEILRYTLDRIKVNRVYVDRGFFDSKSVIIFKSFRLKFLIPCTENSRIKRFLEVMPAPSVINDYEMETSFFNLVILKDEEGNKRSFATNEEYDDNDVNLTERIFLLYGRRWGVETSYRVKKHSFLPKTASKNYMIRLFYFLFSVLLYNLWILADILIWLYLFGFVGKWHILKSKFFGTVLYTVDPGG